MEEVWKEIKGYEGLYEISDLGRVKSLGRKCESPKGFRRVPEKILNPSRDSDGYLMVVLHNSGVRKTCKVHQLVANHFLQNPNGYPLVCHKDGKRDQNYEKNLYFGTQKDNSLDMVRHGNSVSFFGDKNPMAKLAERQVRVIKYALGFGATQEFLAKAFNVCQTNISFIKLEKTWSHVTI